jgi:alpha-L-fucosidase 2
MYSLKRTEIMAWLNNGEEISIICFMKSTKNKSNVRQSLTTESSRGMSMYAGFFIILISFCFNGFAQPVSFKNIWTTAPVKIPNYVSIDAPLMGNGDVTMSIGYVPDRLRFYLSKNDFWRLKSQADNMSGPRIAAFVDINLNNFNNDAFQAEQNLSDGATTCTLSKNGLKVISWVSATENLIFIELEGGKTAMDISVDLTAPYNHQAILKTGNDKNISWLTRSFTEDVDIPTEVAVSMKIINQTGNSFTLQPGQKIIIALAVEGKFKTENPLPAVLYKCTQVDEKTVQNLRQKQEHWWNGYWDKSSVEILLSGTLHHGCMQQGQKIPTWPVWMDHIRYTRMERRLSSEL